MENFSEFFESVVSGGKKPGSAPSSDLVKPRYNNDIIYTNSNNIYNKQPSQVFPTEDYYILSNEIILGATKLYHEIYDSLSTPFCFIDYYFIEFKNHTHNSSNYLKKFILLFDNKKNKILNAVTIFTKVYKTQAQITEITKSMSPGNHLVITKDLLDKNINYSRNIDSNLKTATTETKNIISLIKNSVSETNFKFRYIEYLTNTNTIINEDVPPQQVNVSRQKKFIVPPRQIKSDKITSITLPKLKIGKRYITSLTHSRIDSAHFAFKFLEPDKSYALIKKYRLIKVKFTQGFETKRKSLFEVKKSSFDLF